MALVMELDRERTRWSDVESRIAQVKFGIESTLTRGEEQGTGSTDRAADRFIAQEIECHVMEIVGVHLRTETLYAGYAMWNWNWANAYGIRPDWNGSHLPINKSATSIRGRFSMLLDVDASETYNHQERSSRAEWNEQRYCSPHEQHAAREGTG
eukprot:CAMPEP_0115844574 /NCGR_PEP_ID=MMETSP0287-20121206/8898_1 /TAXON_ID=412157 /ORGANISM="Chrysochromulina rotalis, Strain UIO044" /LENGTH=153 /DNA_ID=CAMNT_0003298303 /DNA_START=512 /DNA_END=969 /DNA_ORIENTATION=-